MNTVTRQTLTYLIISCIHNAYKRKCQLISKEKNIKKKKEIGGFFKIMILFDFEFVCLIFFILEGGWVRLGSCVQWIHHEEFYKFD